MTAPVVGQGEWRQTEGAAQATVLAPAPPETAPAVQGESAAALLFSMGGILRVFVWGLALLLTAAVLLYPVHLRLVDVPIQSMAIIDSLALER